MKALGIVILFTVFFYNCEQTEPAIDPTLYFEENTTESDLQLMGIRGEVRSVKNRTFYQKKFSIDSGNGYTKETFYVFNESGDRVGKNSHDGGLTSYFREGKEVIDKKVRHNPNVEISYNEIYKMNKDGLPIVHNIFDIEGNLIFEELYKYNDNKDIVERNHNDLTRDVSYHDKYSYSYTGIIKERSKYVIYNNYSQRISMKKYNAYGDIIENYDVDFYGELDSSVVVTLYEYEYDKKGNWIKKSVYESDNLTHIDLRDIQYYE